MKSTKLEKGNAALTPATKRSVERSIPPPTIPDGDMKQAIALISHNVGNYVEVLINTGTLDDNGEFHPIYQLQKNTFITGADYEMLMAGNPEWAPAKPEGVFRDSDLFAFMDYLESIE